MIPRKSSEKFENGLAFRPGDKKINISGGITTYGGNVHCYYVEGGVEKINIKNDVAANGNNSIAVKVSNDRQKPLTNISATSKQGIAVQISKGKVALTDKTYSYGAKRNDVEI